MPHAGAATLQTADNNAAVYALSPNVGNFIRLGYANPGDGGWAAYTTTTTNCSLNNGAGDGGSQIGLAGSGSSYIGCALIDWQSVGNVASIALFGAVANDTDMSSYMMAAAAAMSVIGGGEVVIPATTTPWGIKNTFSQPYTNVTIRCQPGAVLDRLSATGNMVFIGNSSSSGGPAQNTGIQGCTFKHSTAATSGADVELSGNRNTFANNIKILKGAFQGVAVDNGVLTEIANLQESAEGTSAIALGCNGAQAADVTIRGGNINYQHNAAVEECNVSGVTFNGGLNTDFNTHGLWCHPGSASARCNGNYAVDPFFDTSFAEGVLLDLTNGPGFENHFGPNTWSASCGGSTTAPTTNALTGDSFATPFTVTANAPCVHVIASPTALTGAGAFVDNEWQGRAFNAGGEGVRVEGGLYNDYGGESIDNCVSMTTGSCAGFHALNAVSHWTWNGRAGGQSGLGRTSGQLYGVAIDSSSDYFSIRGDLSGNKTAPLIGGGTALHADYEGMLPSLSYSVYTPTVTPSSGSLTSYSASGQYLRKGTTVFFSVSIKITTNGSAAGYLTVSLPLQATTNVPITVAGREDASTGNALAGQIPNGATTMAVENASNNSYPGANGYQLDLTGSYTVTQ